MDFAKNNYVKDKKYRFDRIMCIRRYPCVGIYFNSSKTFSLYEWRQTHSLIGSNLSAQVSQVVMEISCS